MRTTNDRRERGGDARGGGDEEGRDGFRKGLIAFAIIEAAVFIPFLLYMIFRRP